MSLDYRQLGLKVGIEIHQQLDTATKLFCTCRAELSPAPPELTFYRRLRPTQSELGAIDPAAAFEFQRGRGFLYEADTETSCLVEMDEEPPHALDNEAVEIGLTVTMMLNARPIDEIHVMRKIVLDGSNTTGFQRTCIISLGGEVTVEGKTIGVQTVSLEEDAARKTGEEGTTTRYRIDRLCVPLVEIATAPQIYSAEEAEKVALTLGRILRATGRVRRGLGTIRQDLNVSIEGGALTEIKGVQELELVKPVIDAEARRQTALLEISKELKNRAITEEHLKMDITDVSEVFTTTECKVLMTAFEKGLRIMALRLPKFMGLLGKELTPGLRFGTELSDYAKFWGRAGGIFHTDELPAYGITQEEVIGLREATKAEPNDAVVVVAQKKEDALDSLTAVLERAKAAIVGVPSETRAASPDGTSHFSRPRPGASRMYPETDVPPFVVSREHLIVVRSNLPLLPQARIAQFTKEFGLNQRLASQVLNSEYAQLFERLARETSIPPAFIAATLTETFKSLRRESLDLQHMTDEEIENVFKSVDAGKAAKEAIPDIIRWLVTNQSKTLKDAMVAMRLQPLLADDVEAYTDRIVSQNERIIREKGIGALGPLMGEMMRELRGRVDAVHASSILKRKIESKLNG